MVDDDKELVEKMLVAFLTEKSAQCGEPFYMDMWEEYKREKPDEYHEEFVQMQCALAVALTALKTTTDCPASLSGNTDAQTAAMSLHDTPEDAQDGGVIPTQGTTP